MSDSREASPLADNRSQRVSRTVLILVTLVALAIGVVGIVLLPNDVFWSGDGGVKRIQVESLLRSGGSTLVLEYPGAEIDRAGLNFPISPPFAYPSPDGFRSGFPPTFAWLSTLPCALFGSAGLYVLPMLAGVGILVLMLVLAPSFSLGRWETLLVASLTGLATPLPFYAMAFWEHSLFALLMLAAIGLLVVAHHATSDQRATIAGGVAGVLFGAAAWLRPESAVFAGCSGVAVLLSGLLVGRRLRVFLACGAGIVVPVGGLLWFNAAVYGDVLGNHLRQVTGDDAFNGSWLEQHASALTGMLVGGQGLLWHVPLVILFLLRPLLRGRGATVRPTPVPIRFLQIVVVLTLFGISAGVPNDGNLQWGPRYLLPLIPMMTLLAVEALPLGRGRRGATLFGAIVLLVLGGYGGYKAVSGVRRLDERKTHEELPALRILQQSQAPVCIFTNPWFAQGMAASFFETQMFQARSPGELLSLSQRLAMAGVRAFIVVGGAGPQPRSRQRVLSESRNRRLIAVPSGVAVHPPYRFERWQIREQSR